MRKVIILVLLAALAFDGSAATKKHEGLTYSTTAVKTGVWSSKFAKCKAYAEKHGRPLITLWANLNCSYCARVCSSLGSSSGFKSWMSSSGSVFVFGLGKTGGENPNIKSFAYPNPPVGTSYPFLSVYLKQKGASSKSVYKSYSMGGRSAAEILSIIKQSLKKYARIKLKAETGGTVTQVGYRKIGAYTTIVATPASKYKFKGWYNSSGKRVSTKASYKFKVTKAATYTAKFTKK